MPVSPFISPSEVWKFGTHERTARLSPIALFAEVTNAATTLISTFYKQGTAAGYAVTAGTTLIITRIVGYSTVTLGVMNFRYSDNDIGRDAAGPGTNPVYLDSDGDGTAGTLSMLTAAQMYDFNVYFEIPAGKYFSVESLLANSALRLSAYGHEV